MHIAFVVANYPPHVGGVERHVASLAAELRKRSIAVTVFNLEHRGVRLEDGVEVIGLGRHLDVGEVLAVPDPGAVRRVSRELRARGATHVSVHTRFFPATWVGLRAARRAGLPTTLTEHGGGFVSTGSAVVDTGARVVDHSMGRWALRRADALLAVSQTVERFVQSLAQRPVTVCGNGIDTGFWRGEPDRRDEVVFVGRVAQTKGWRTYLDIVAAMPGHITGRILGDGPDFEACQREIDRLGLHDRVAMLGRVPAETVRAAVSGAVLLNPSTASEGLQTTLLEAAACGARVATYDVGGAREAAASGASVFIAPKSDSIALRDAARQALGAPCRAANLETFSWPAVTDRYLRAWQLLA